MGLDRIVIGALSKILKNTTKFEITIDDLLFRFKESCPSDSELKNIIKQKNQIKIALEQITGVFSTMDKTALTLDKVLTGINVVVKVLKNIPIPTAIPPGIGIPISILNKFADALDVLKDNIQKGQGVLKIIPPSIDIMSSSAQKIIDKLQVLDGFISSCVQKKTQNLTEEEKNKYFTDLEISANEIGDSSNIKLNFTVNNTLEQQLQPNSNNPIYYKDYKLSIENDPLNSFSFPSRRIKGFNLNNKHTLYNLFDNGYSFASSTQVLMNEIKFRIDSYLNQTPLVSKKQPVIGDSPNNLGGKVENNINSNPLEDLTLYSPFGEPGVDKEIRINNKVYYKFNSLKNAWEIFTPNLKPFDTPGKSDGEIKNYNGLNYEWVQVFYKWNPI